MDIVGKRNWFFGFSGLLVVVGIIALALWGLKFGIDFTGGTLMELSFNKSVEAQTIKNDLQGLDFLSSMQVQNTGTNSVIIKTPPLSKDQEAKVTSILNEKIGQASVTRLETVGPTVGKDLTKKAIIAVILASLAIVIYIAWAFRTVPKPASSWRFGVCAIIALLHDIFITIGIYALFGHFFGYEVDSLFITALLTVMGFSVHDTIVVFDRVRENLRRFPSRDFPQNVNSSIAQTLVRSLNTSLTLILVLLSLVLIGGGTIRHFVATLLVGVTIGTYSSIFNASLLLVVWQNYVTKKALIKSELQNN